MCGRNFITHQIFFYQRVISYCQSWAILVSMPWLSILYELSIDTQPSIETLVLILWHQSSKIISIKSIDTKYANKKVPAIPRYQHIFGLVNAHLIPIIALLSLSDNNFKSKFEQKIFKEEDSIIFDSSKSIKYSESMIRLVSPISTSCLP